MSNTPGYSGRPGLREVNLTCCWKQHKRDTAAEMDTHSPTLTHLRRRSAGRCSEHKQSLLQYQRLASPAAAHTPVYLCCPATLPSVTAGCLPFTALLLFHPNYTTLFHLRLKGKYKRDGRAVFSYSRKYYKESFTPTCEPARGRHHLRS